MQLKLSRAALLDTLSNPDELKRLRNLKRPNVLTDTPDTTTEKKLADWLGRLKLLHGVPFNYLVPDVTMLPLESIRFFYCDTIWLDYLAEGALSLGRSTSGDKTHDKAFLGDLHVYSRFGMKQQRGKVLGHLTVHLSVQESLLLNTAPIPATEKVSGFLLRSGVVSGWEGLQVEAFDAQNNPCQVLRMDHLSENVLLCMYEGMVETFKIHEYPEVLHFGFNASGAPIKYSKSFRYPVNYEGHLAGTDVPVEDAPEIAIAAYERTTRNGGLLTGTGVIRMGKLAIAMKDELKDTKIYDGEFTAAQFALEMVEGVEAVNFTINV